MQCIVVKSDEFENSSPLYIFPLNPDYDAARSLRSLRSNKRGVPFLPKVEYKSVRGSTSGGASPYKTSALTIPPGIAFGGTILAGSPFATRI